MVCLKLINEKLSKVNLSKKEGVESMSNVIETHNLQKKYKDEIVIKSFDFNLRKGEICGLIGKNGAGKSTFFKMLSGQIMSTAGKIKLFGKNDLVNARKRMGFLIEEPQFFPDLTAQQNLQYFRIQRGVVEKSKIEEVLEQVGLADQVTKKVKAYSMGMKQRLGIALCLLSSPDCLVLDEPINGLDPEGINEIRQLLLKLNQENQITILISSHILSEIQMIATRFVFFNRGEIIEDIKSMDLQKKCQKRLKLKADKHDKIAQLLERNFSNITYQCLPNQEIHIFDHLDKSEEINRLLVINDIQVSDFHLEDLRLEDYFLKLVGGSKHD